MADDNKNLKPLTPEQLDGVVGGGGEEPIDFTFQSPTIEGFTYRTSHFREGDDDPINPYTSDYFTLPDPSIQDA